MYQLFFDILMCRHTFRQKVRLWSCQYVQEAVGIIIVYLEKAKQQRESIELVRNILKYINRGRCEKLIKYQNRSFEFKEISAEFAGGKLSFEGLTTELRNIDSIAETARALDDFHYLMCNDLSNPILKENLTKEDLRQYTKILVGAHVCILNFRSALEAFNKDPQRQGANLDRSIVMIRNYVSSVTPGFITEEGHKAISEALSSAK